MKIQDIYSELPDFLRNMDPDILLSKNYLVIDFETTNIDKGNPYDASNRIVCSAYGKKDYSHRYGSEFEQDALAERAEKVDFIVAHNSKFELGWLHRMGVDTSKILGYCTQIGEYVKYGNLPKGKLASLDRALAVRKLGQKSRLVSTLIKGGMCPSEIPKSWLIRYVVEDVRLTEKLFLLQLEELRKLGLLPVMFTRSIVTPVLVDIERRGLYLDGDRVRLVHKYHSDKLKHLEEEWNNITGGVNVNSPLQKRELLYETLKFAVPIDHRRKPLLTPKGEYATNDKAIQKLKAKNKKQERFLEVFKDYNSTKSMLQKFVDKLLDCVQESEGVLQAQYNQTITSTHRLSSTGKKHKIQLQNIARILKGCFTAREAGWEVAEIDSDGLEFRIAVNLAGDEVGIQDISTGRDPHGYTASIIFDNQWKGGKGPDDKRIRTAAKEHTFKPLYGGMSGTAKEVEYYKAFQERYSGITAAQERWQYEVLKTKKLITATGLRFYWPDVSISNSGYINYRTSICNYPVQNLATAEVVLISLVYQWHLMKAAKMRSFLVNTVHDSTIGEVAPEEKDLYKKIAELCFTSVATDYLESVYNIVLTCPLSATVEYNTHWGDSGEWLNNWSND